MSEIAILGSGFGLYGYLPALVKHCGQRVVIPERYRAKFMARNELADCARQVRWVADEQAALTCASGAVLALCPAQQTRWLGECIQQAQLEFLILEKPLATDPGTALTWLNRLRDSGKTIRIAYLFRYLAWAQMLQKRLLHVELEKLTIQWQFMAHHFRNDLQNWKRDHRQGGGALRFYGIHLIALLAEFGYQTTNWSITQRTFPYEFGRWRAEFSGPGLPECNIEVDTGSSERTFTLTCNASSGQVQHIDDDPFELRSHVQVTGEIDRRVSVLAEFCKSAWTLADNPGEMYERVVRLWQSVEDCDQSETKTAAA